MNNTYDHIEELVDRFVTNTATPEETDQLFDAIAERPELGNKLAAASRLQAEFDRDLAMIDVPAGLYESIVAAAPFTTATVGAATAASVSSASSAAMIAIGAASGLAAISLVVLTAVTLFTGNDAVTTDPQQVITGAAHVKPAASAAPIAPTVSVSANAMTSPSEGQMVSPFSEAPTPSEPTPLSDVVERFEQPLMITAANILPVDSALNNTNMELTTHPFTTTPTTTSTTSFFLRVQQRPLTGTSASQSAVMLSNLGLEASASVSRDLLLGVGAYHDVFPMKVVQTNGDTADVEDMYWGGAHARWQPELSLPFDLGVFAQLTLGGSSRGIITQPSLGITKTIGPVDLGLGVDCSAFAFQNNGSWNMTLQPGLRATIGFKFE